MKLDDRMFAPTPIAKASPLFPLPPEREVEDDVRD